MPRINFSISANWSLVIEFNLYIYSRSLVKNGTSSAFRMLYFLAKKN